MEGRIHPYISLAAREDYSLKGSISLTPESPGSTQADYSVRSQQSSTEERTAHAKSKQKPKGFLNVETKLRETQWLYSPVKCTVPNLVLR